MYQCIHTRISTYILALVFQDFSSFSTKSSNSETQTWANWNSQRNLQLLIHIHVHTHTTKHPSTSKTPKNVFLKHIMNLLTLQTVSGIIKSCNNYCLFYYHINKICNQQWWNLRTRNYNSSQVIRSTPSPKHSCLNEIHITKCSHRKPLATIPFCKYEENFCGLNLNFTTEQQHNLRRNCLTSNYLFPNM